MAGIRGSGHLTSTSKVTFEQILLILHDCMVYCFSSREEETGLENIVDEEERLKQSPIDKV